MTQDNDAIENLEDKLKTIIQIGLIQYKHL
jgi:hypothetical protein